jgi:hypothetical protein
MAGISRQLPIRRIRVLRSCLGCLCRLRPLSRFLPVCPFSDGLPAVAPVGAVHANEPRTREASDPQVIMPVTGGEAVSHHDRDGLIQVSP